MNEGAPVVLVAGPQTRLAMAINSVARGTRALAARGLNARPNRPVMSTLRDAARADDDAVGQLRVIDRELGLSGGSRGLLTPVNLFGPPEHAFLRRAFYPDAERLLASVARGIALARPRLVVTVEPVHGFLFHLGRTDLDERLRTADWESVYDVNWAELIGVLMAAFPGSGLLVVTPEAGFVRARALCDLLFGPAADDEIADRLRTPLLSLEGQAAYAALGADLRASAETLEALFAAHAARPGEAEMKARTGIDRLTAKLLEARFAEDLAAIEKLPGVEVF